MRDIPASVLTALQTGRVIPAHPLALDADGRFDEQRQRALTRYYVAAGSGGLAVGVHTTQFAIRDPAVGLFERVLAIAADEMNRADALPPRTVDSHWRHLRPDGPGAARGRSPRAARISCRPAQPCGAVGCRR